MPALHTCGPKLCLFAPQGAASSLHTHPSPAHTTLLPPRPSPFPYPQREVAELGGPSLLVQLIRSRMPYLTTSPSGAPGDPRSESPPPSPTKFLVPTQPGADVDIQTVIQALNLLTNLSANDDLAAAVALIPGCPGLMVTLLGHPHAPVAVHAARVLINLTHSCAEAQAAAVKVGGWRVG